MAAPRSSWIWGPRTDAAAFGGPALVALAPRRARPSPPPRGHRAAVGVGRLRARGRRRARPHHPLPHLPRSRRAPPPPRPLHAAPDRRVRPRRPAPRPLAGALLACPRVRRGLPLRPPADRLGLDLPRARRRARPRRPPAFDHAVTYVATLYPIAYWHAHIPRAFHWFDDDDFVPWSGLAAALPVLRALHAGLLCAYVGREAWLYRARRFTSWGKHLVVLSTAALWYTGIVATNDDFTFTVTNVLGHGVPYVVLLWMYVLGRARERQGAFVARVAAAGGLAFLALVLAVAFAEEALWDRLVWHQRPWLFGGVESPTPLYSDLLRTLVVPLLLGAPGDPLRAGRGPVAPQGYWQSTGRGAWLREGVTAEGPRLTGAGNRRSRRPPPAGPRRRAGETSSTPPLPAAGRADTPRGHVRRRRVRPVDTQPVDTQPADARRRRVRQQDTRSAPRAGRTARQVTTPWPEVTPVPVGCRVRSAARDALTRRDDIEHRNRLRHARPRRSPRIRRGRSRGRGGRTQERRRLRRPVRSRAGPRLEGRSWPGWLGRSRRGRPRPPGHAPARRSIITGPSGSFAGRDGRTSRAARAGATTGLAVAVGSYALDRASGIRYSLSHTDGTAADVAALLSSHRNGCSCSPSGAPAGPRHRRPSAPAEARNRDSARANASESEKRSSRDLASARMTIRSNAAGIGCGAAALGGNGTSVACARKSSGSLRDWSNGPRPTTIR